jgi:hypothetical protein
MVDTRPSVVTAGAPVEDPARPAARRRWPVPARNALLTAHIVFSVALLGDSAA